jgi:hypothetical protein
VAEATDYNGGDGLDYVSNNSGTRWTATQTNWWSLVATGNKLVATIDGWNIDTSADSGVSWTRTSAPTNEWSSVASSADGTKLVAVAFWDFVGGLGLLGDGLIYTSTNGGANWTQTSAPTNNWSSVACSADGTTLVAGASARDFSEGGGAVYTSTNSGADWVQAPLPFESWISVACSADGIELVAAALTGQIYVSKDSGATWTWDEAPAVPWQAVAVSANGSNIVAVTSVGPIYVKGATVPAFPPPPAMEIAPSADGLKISWIVPSANFVLQQSSDLPSTASWTTVPAGPVLNFTNLRYELTVSPSLGSRFYRLKLQ